MTRIARFLALLLVLGGACSSDDGSTDDAADPATTEPGPVATAAPTESSDAGESPHEAGIDCDAATSVLADAGELEIADADDVREVVERTRRLADAAVGSLRDDLLTTADALDGVADEYERAAVEPGTTPDLAAFDDPDFVEASARIEAALATDCGIDLGA